MPKENWSLFSSVFLKPFFLRPKIAKKNDLQDDCDPNKFE